MSGEKKKVYVLGARGRKNYDQMMEQAARLERFGICAVVLDVGDMDPAAVNVWLRDADENLNA